MAEANGHVSRKARPSHGTRIWRRRLISITVLCIAISVTLDVLGRRLLALQLHRAAVAGVICYPDVEHADYGGPTLAASVESDLRASALRLADWQRQNPSICAEIDWFAPARARIPTTLAPEQRAAIEAYVSDNAEVIESVGQLALSGAIDQGVAPPAHTDAFANNPALQRRTIITSLGLASLCAADDGEVSRACVWIEAMSKVERTIRSDDLVSEAASLGSERAIARLAEVLLAPCAVGAEELERLQNIVSNSQEGHSTQQTIRNVLSARYQGMLAAQSDLWASAWTRWDPAAVAYSVTPGLAHCDAARAVALCVADAEGMALSARAALDWYRVRDSSVRKTCSCFPLARSVDTLRVTPALERLLETSALLSAAEAGVAAERFRSTHGVYPSTLAELVPSFLGREAEDPFDGLPLKYERCEDGILVWSVGAAGTSAERAERAGSTGRGQSQIAFRVSRR
jgi:hypothetical protein